MIAGNGNKVTVHYLGTFEDGTEFDSSYAREEPINFELGKGQMIAGFEKAVTGMSVGESKDVQLEPTEAYGDRTEEAVRAFGRSAFPENFEFQIGAFVTAQTEDNSQIMARIMEFNDSEVILDFNHPMAGKTLNFKIELLNIA